MQTILKIVPETTCQTHTFTASDSPPPPPPFLSHTTSLAKSEKVSNIFTHLRSFSLKFKCVVATEGTKTLSHLKTVPGRKGSGCEWRELHSCVSGVDHRVCVFVKNPLHVPSAWDPPRVPLQKTKFVHANYFEDGTGTYMSVSHFYLFLTFPPKWEMLSTSMSKLETVNSSESVSVHGQGLDPC